MSQVPALTTPNLDEKFATEAVNTIRMLAADAVQQAKSGHPGLPMGMAPAEWHRSHSIRASASCAIFVIAFIL